MTRAQWIDAEAGGFVLDAHQPTVDRPRGLSEPSEAPPRFRPARWFFGLLALFVSALVGFDLDQFLVARFHESRALGIGYAALLGVVVLSALAWGFLELRALRRLRSVDDARARLRGKQGETAAEVAGVISEISRVLSRRPSLSGAVKRYEQKVQSTHEPEQRLRLFKQEVLAQVDDEGYRVVGRATRDVGILTTVMPTALADAVVMAWRNVRMVREVAELYGYRTGPIATWVLVRKLLTGVAWVAATDVAGTVIADQVGGALTHVMASRLGGSAVATLRTLRLGLLAMQLCRAVPFGEDETPSLRRFTAAVLPSASHSVDGES